MSLPIPLWTLMTLLSLCTLTSTIPSTDIWRKLILQILELTVSKAQENRHLRQRKIDSMLSRSKLNWMPNLQLSIWHNSSLISTRWKIMNPSTTEQTDEANWRRQWRWFTVDNLQGFQGAASIAEMQICSKILSVRAEESWNGTCRQLWESQEYMGSSCFIVIVLAASMQRSVYKLSITSSTTMAF
jgi:hypothetical protein